MGETLLTTSDPADRDVMAKAAPLRGQHIDIGCVCGFSRHGFVMLAARTHDRLDRVGFGFWGRGGKERR